MAAAAIGPKAFLVGIVLPMALFAVFTPRSLEQDRFQMTGGTFERLMGGLEWKTGIGLMIERCEMPSRRVVASLTLGAEGVLMRVAVAVRARRSRVVERH